MKKKILFLFDLVKNDKTVHFINENVWFTVIDGVHLEFDGYILGAPGDDSFLSIIREIYTRRRQTENSR